MDKSRAILVPKEVREWQPSLCTLRCPKGRVAVEMYPDKDETLGNLVHVVDSTYRVDAGWVVASGEDVPIEAGTNVLLSPYSGFWQEGEAYGSWVPDNQIRFFGIKESWWRSIVATYEDGVLKPTKDGILLRRDETVNKSKSGLILPDGATYRTCQAVVVEVGPDVQEVSPGERVVYSPRSGARAARELNLDSDPELVLVSEKDIYAVIEE